MPDRADYLARIILTRARELESTWEENLHPTEAALNDRRRELIGKVLAVEEGITDGLTVNRIAAALPAAPPPNRDYSKREVTELAEFLRTRLSLT